jgi:hypothetical protein
MTRHGPRQSGRRSRRCGPRGAAQAAGTVALLALGLLAAGLAAQPPVAVKIQQEKATVEEVSLPVDPTMRAQPSFVGNMAYGLNIEGKRLTFGAGSARTTFRIDGQVLGPGGQQQPLPPGPRGKARTGVQTVWDHNGLRVTQTMEVVPGKPSAKPKPGEKRRMDTLLIRYTIENKDTRPRSVGVRMHMDTYCWTTDGCLFAAPTVRPGQVLDGVELKGKDVPEYAMQLQMPNIQNPGWVGHYTFRIGRYEPPSRVIFTSLGANQDGWNVQAIQAGGDSAAAFFWDDQKIPPGGKRELAYAHGQGIATSPENEGRVAVEFGGSFAPGKRFTVAAQVDDPVDGQSLTLELPEGLELCEGPRVQPVPAPNADNRSIVYWRGQVQRLGTFPVRIRSSNGVTYTTTVTVSRP